MRRGYGRKDISGVVCVGKFQEEFFSHELGEKRLDTQGVKSENLYIRI